MTEKHVSGEMQAVGWREGSSGKFTGDISGLYEGYRWGDLEEERAVLSVAHGSIAVILRHKHASRGRPRGENPFAGGQDPLEGRPAMDRPGGGPPGGGRPGGGPPGGQRPAEGQEGGFRPASMGALAANRPIRETQCILEIDGANSTGIYAGASGEVTLTVPNLKDAGYLVVTTNEGDLRLSFLEWSEGPNLVADLWVDGDQSTGVYAGAQGTLTFSLAIDPGKGMAIGPYSGTLQLKDAS